MRDQIVSAARGWIGTPYHHQASCREAGADCLGLIRGVWREVFGSEPEPVPAYPADWDEVAQEERLWRAAARHMNERMVGTERPGDMLLFRMREGSVAKHLGILTESGETPRFVHAYSRHAVVETHLTQPWKRRLVAVFSFSEEATSWPR